ncbi:3-keto-disaccharide hydrolase [Algoriphagus yeomjeoni]|uniref:3-keto-disaccharide hydrolase n=1 Tax=Algoriphagus yeomjeoni TaxID=291403 RepID=UPI003CE579C4
MKINYIIVAALAGILASCSGEKTVETEVEEVTVSESQEEEWVDLFANNNFSKWHKYNGGDAIDGWKIENGEVYLDVKNIDREAGEGGDIVTNEEFENFHLKYDWKIAENGNSGLIFYVQEAPEYENTYNTGLEMQVLDNDGHPDAKIISHRAGDLYDLIVSSEETVKPHGEWNSAEIISNNGQLDLILNGTTVVSTTLWTPEWEALVADSKFKDMPNWGTFKKGRIALQDHSDLVYFKNVMIKKL